MSLRLLLAVYLLQQEAFGVGTAPSLTRSGTCHSELCLVLDVKTFFCFL